MVERPSRALASDGSDFENADGGRCRIAKSGGQGLPLPQLFRLYTPHQSYSVSINISNDILTNGHSNRQTHSILALPCAAVIAKRLGSLSQHNATKRVMTTHRVMRNDAGSLGSENPRWMDMRATCVLPIYIKSQNVSTSTLFWLFSDDTPSRWLPLSAMAARKLPLSRFLGA